MKNSGAFRRPALFLSMPILYAAAALPAVDSIDEIQVTATRRPITAADVSAALSIVSRPEIRQVKLTTDALGFTPGVYLQQTTPGQGAAIIRGLKGSEILHLVDGFRLNNAIFRNAPTQYLSLVSPGAVERIEVLRGAPASLYGSDAVGGVVQVLSRIPAFASADKEMRGDAYAAYDTAESGRILRASLELGNRDIAGIVSAEYLRAGDRRIGGGERIGPSGYESRGGRVALSVTPASGNDWLLDFQFARQPSTPRVDELVPGFGQTEPSSSEFLFSPNERYFTHIRHTRSDSLWGADWTVDAGWQRIVDDRITRNFQAPERRNEQNKSDLFGLTANASNASQNGSWIAGFEFYHDVVSSFRSEENLLNGDTQIIQSRFPDGATVDQAALYGNLLHRVANRHTLSGGVRISRVSVDLPLSGIGPSITRVNDLSADLGYLIDLTAQMALTANLGHGFRAPNVFDMGTLGERPGGRFNIPNPDLQSEHVTQLDIGLRWRSENWDADFSVYSLRYTDRITSVLTGSTTPDGRDVVQSRNTASATIYGLEASLNWLVSDILSAIFVLNYTRGEQTDEDATLVAADRIPPLNGRIALRFEPNDSWYVEQYLRFAARQTRLSPRDLRDVRIDPDGTNGWGTLNIRAQWMPKDNLRFGLALENLLDERYRVHGSGIDAVGRSLGASVQVAW